MSIYRKGANFAFASYNASLAGQLKCIQAAPSINYDTSHLLPSMYVCVCACSHSHVVVVCVCAHSRACACSRRMCAFTSGRARRRLLCVCAVCVLSRALWTFGPFPAGDVYPQLATMVRYGPLTSVSNNASGVIGDV